MKNLTMNLKTVVGFPFVYENKGLKFDSLKVPTECKIRMATNAEIECGDTINEAWSVASVNEKRPAKGEWTGDVPTYYDMVITRL